jgi:hypothetical protein
LERGGDFPLYVAAFVDKDIEERIRKDLIMLASVF